MKYNFKNELDHAELDIFDEIDTYFGINANDIKEKLIEAQGKPLDIHINSGGGDVFEGFAIYNLIKQYNGNTTVYIDGIAASIASVIALAGNKIIMSKASMMMIHNASGGCWGNAEEMEKVVEALKQINSVIRNIYLSKTNLDDEQLTVLMDNETFMTPQQCLDWGFCDEVADNEPTEQDTTIIQNAMNNVLEQVNNRLKTINDLKNALNDIGGTKTSVIEKESAFLNKKSSHWDWLKGKEI